MSAESVAWLIKTIIVTTLGLVVIKSFNLEANSPWVYLAVGAIAVFTTNKPEERKKPGSDKMDRSK